MTVPVGKLKEGAVRRHPVLAFSVLACLISWSAVFPLIRHADIAPAWHALGALGPVAAALIMTTILGGRLALGDFARRMVRWRVGTIAWLLALSPILVGAIALALLTLMGAPLNGAATVRRAFADPTWVGGMFLASLAYGLGEEPGWRGFALPLLEQRRSAFRATVLLTVAWGIWHVPYFFYRYTMGGVGEYVGFYLGLFTGALWLTFLYNSTGGSILIVVVWHTLWNAVALIAAVISPTAVAVSSVIIMISGLIAVAIGGPRRLSWTFRRRLPSPVVTASPRGRTQ